MTRRVLYLHANSQLGGSQISLLTLMRHLDSKRYIPYLLINGRGPYWDLASSYGVKTSVQAFPWFSKRHPWNYLTSAVQLYTRYLLNSCCLVHTNCLRSLSYAGRQLSTLGIPYVCHVRDGIQPWFAESNLSLLNGAENVITNSEAISTMCRENGVRPELVRTVYNPIECKKPSDVDRREELLSQLLPGVPQDVFIFGLLGRVEPMKGQDEFIAAARIVVTRIGNAHFLIVGDARERLFLSHLRELVRAYELDRVVHFVGFQHDTAKILSLFDALVVPSRSEYPTDGVLPLGSVGRQYGFGRVIVEGMAAGCPVIAAGIDGISEVVEHERNGLVVPPSNPDALAQAMIRLVGDPSLRTRLSTQGKLTASRFSPETHSQSIQTLYDEVLSRRSRRQG